MKNKNEKTKNDEPWVACGSENRFDIFTSFQHFDVNFEYESNLTRKEEKYYLDTWNAVDELKEGKLSAWNKKKEIAYGSESDLGKVYLAITTD